MEETSIRQTRRFLFGVRRSSTVLRLFCHPWYLAMCVFFFGGHFFIFVIYIFYTFFISCIFYFYFFKVFFIRDFFVFFFIIINPRATSGAPP